MSIVHDVHCAGWNEDEWDKRFSSRSSVLWWAVKETILLNITQYYRNVNLHIDITAQDEIQLHCVDIEHGQDISIGWNQH